MCKLHSDDRVVNELLAESAALVRILHAFFVADTREAETLDDDANALVIEVGHDDYHVMLAVIDKTLKAHPTLEALILLANQILDRNLDVFEGHVSSTARPDTLAVHASGVDTAS